MRLADAVALLERIAPRALAEEWDNVGLLLAPSRPRDVARALLAIDLTEAVLDEAVAYRCELVVAYHPPIFEPLRSLDPASPRARLLVRACERRIAIHSPHTALDSAPGGLNDWLADGIDAKAPRRAIQESGQGRALVLSPPRKLDDLLARIRKRLGCDRLRVARHPRHAREPIASVALCAGAGGSVIGETGADLLFTGEMGHHHVLAALERGSSVALAEHGLTERAGLPDLARRLRRESKGALAVRVSTRDRGPLEWR